MLLYEYVKHLKISTWTDQPWNADVDMQIKILPHCSDPHEDLP